VEWRRGERVGVRGEARYSEASQPTVPTSVIVGRGGSG
jgi:hypothetical protein